MLYTVYTPIIFGKSTQGIGALSVDDVNALKSNSIKKGLTTLIHPSYQSGWEDLIKSGWSPSFFNQQWGGANMPLPNGEKGDYATGSIGDESFLSIGSSAGNVYRAMGMQVSQTGPYKKIILKIYKIGNPTDNFEVSIYNDSSGEPGSVITNGVSIVQSGKLHTSNNNGEWCTFTFSVNPSLSAGTQYHIVITRSGSVDASNYWAIKESAGGYPFGNDRVGDVTPTWGSVNTYKWCFVVVVESSLQFLQDSGLFNGKLIFNEGSPLDQSRGLTKPLKEMMDDNIFTYRLIGNSFTKDKPIIDCQFGMDHDRIILRANVTTGYLQLDLYESNETNHNIMGTTDVSGATDKDIIVVCRFKGDGSDFIKLYVDGILEDSLISQTFTMSKEFRDLGHCILGGGLPLPPTWTDDLDMSVLPSTLGGWAWAGTGTEADCMSIQNNKLHQNKNGYGATETGYYTKATGGFNNTNGWAVTWKSRVTYSQGLNGSASVMVQMFDGTKVCISKLNSYFFTSQASNSYNYQRDLTDREHVFLMMGKGSDFYVFMDGKLVFDGTGLSTNSTALNVINLGNQETVSGDNADAVWDYLKSYATNDLYPEFTGATLHEFSFWSEDKTDLVIPLYNNNNFISTKEFCGVGQNYSKEIKRVILIAGIVQSPTTTSTIYVLLDNMELFVLSYSTMEVSFSINAQNSVINEQVYLNIYDSGNSKEFNTRANQQAVALTRGELSTQTRLTHKVGLRKIEGRWKTGLGTCTANNNNRILKINL